MAEFIKYYPSSVLQYVGLAGDTLPLEANLTDNPLSPDGLWLTATDVNVDISLEVDFTIPTTVLDPVDATYVTVLLRQYSTTQTGTPDATVTLLQNSVAIASTSVTVDSGNVVVLLTAPLGSITDSSQLTVLVEANGIGGSPSSRNSVDVGAIELTIAKAEPIVGDIRRGGTNEITVTQTYTIDNPTPFGSTSSDKFGVSVAVDGEYTIIGASGEDAPAYKDAGKVYVYNTLTGELLRTIDNPNPEPQYDNWLDNFGGSVDISGNYAIIGAFLTPEPGGLYTSSGKAYIYDITTGSLLHTLDNPNPFGTPSQDYFGSAVAIDGNYAVVGAYLEDDSGGTSSGKAYIYNTTTGALLHTIDNPNPYGTTASDNFGRAVALSGNYAIIGAYFEDDSSTNAESGKAYIFDVTTGNLVHTLNNPNSEGVSDDDRFGNAVAIDGNVAVVGAYYEDQNLQDRSGKVYVFDVTTGALNYTIDNPNPYGTEYFDNFGNDVSVRGSYIVAGAFYEDSAAGSGSGKAYIFDIATGNLVHQLDNPNVYGTESGDYFGHLVSTDGNNVVVSSFYEDDTQGYTSGAAYIYSVAAGTLTYTLTNPNASSAGSGDADQFGRIMDADGDYTIVTAYYEDDIYGSSAGKVYIYNNITGELVHTLDNPNPDGTTSNDLFGSSVGISGNYAAVGSPYFDNGGVTSGKVYIYSVTTGSVVHILDNPNADGAGAGDYFGATLAIEGQYIIVGAYAEDSYSGAAYIFDVTTGSLLHTLTNPNAYSTTASDYFGGAVGISASYGIVGAYYEDDAGGTQSGAAYIFDLTTGVLLHTLTNPNAYSTSTNDSFGRYVDISDSYALIGAWGEDDATGLSSGVAYLFDVNTGTLINTITDPNAYGTTDGDNFGYPVKLNGNLAAISADLEDDAAGTNSGKVYIFSIPSGDLLATVDNPNAYGESTNDTFGYSIGLTDNQLVVGAHQEDEPAAFESGKVYIFDVVPTEEGSSLVIDPDDTITSTAPGAIITGRLGDESQDNFTFNLLHTVDNPNAYSTFTTDYFGHELAVDGNYGLFATTAEDSADGTNTGIVYVVDLPTGTVLHTIYNPSPYGSGAIDVFGRGVSISGNYAVIGAPQSDDETGNTGGIAYIYDVTTGNLVHTLFNPDPDGNRFNDQFGAATGISGNYAIVSAIAEDEGVNNSGKAYIFDVTTGSLLHTLDNPNVHGTSDIDYFGNAVAIAGDYAIVCAHWEEDALGAKSGKAYVFDVPTGAYLYAIENPDPNASGELDEFGFDAKIFGTRAIISAYTEDDAAAGAAGTDSGKAYIFDITDGTLLHQLDNPNVANTPAGDKFGARVAISEKFAVVGALYEDATGTNSGVSYIFDVNTGNLVDTIYNPNAYGTPTDDWFGRAVGITDEYVVVDAQAEDDAGGTESGKVYIFGIQPVSSITETGIDDTGGGVGPGAILTATGTTITETGIDDTGGGVGPGAVITNVGIGEPVTGGYDNYITISNPNTVSPNSDMFGTGASIGDNYFVLAAPNDNKAHVYDINGTLLYSIDNPDPDTVLYADNFGYKTTAINDTYVVIATPNEDNAGAYRSGIVYVFDVTNGTLIHTITNPNPTGTANDDFFGGYLGLSGNNLLIGAYREDLVGTNAGVAYLYDITTGNLVRTFTSPNPIDPAGDNFGEAVAIDGNNAVIGVRLTEETGATSSGKVYVYDTTTGNLLYTLDNPNVYSTADSDWFGTSVAIYGDYIAVGASGEDSATGTATGVTYVFNSSTGNLIHTIYPPSPTANGVFGSKVSLKGNNLLIGQNDSIGSAHLYDVTTGNLKYSFINPNIDTDTYDQYGLNLDVNSAGTVIIGAPNNDTNGEYAAGIAFLYIPEELRQVTLIDPSDTASSIGSGAVITKVLDSLQYRHVIHNPTAFGSAAFDYFGTAAAMDGDYAIVGASNEGSSPKSGIAYIFDVTTGALLHTLDNPNAYNTADYDRFGNSVGISGNYAIVGAWQEDDAGGTQSGKAYIFDVTTGALLHTLDNPNAYNTSSNDQFGSSVAISGNYAIVGADFEDAPGVYSTNSGKAYIFDVTTGALLHTLDNPDPFQNNSSDTFGISVDISGNNAIVSAWQEDDGTFDGTFAGKAYIFDVTTGALVHTLDNPNAYGTPNSDRFGYDTAISGNYAIVSAHLEDDAGGTSSGKAYIFDVTTGALLHTLDNPNPYSISSNDTFGNSVAISGNYAIVGALDSTEVDGTWEGVAYIFDVTSGNLVYTINDPDLDGTPNNDYFSEAVAISGNYVIVTASGESIDGQDAGIAYIFNLTSGGVIGPQDTSSGIGSGAVITSLASGPPPISSTISYTDTVLAKSPIVYYKLEEDPSVTSTAVDQVGSANGTFVNSPTSDTGLITEGTSVNITQSLSNYVSLPPFPFSGAPTELSAELWCKPTGNRSVLAYIGQYEAGIIYEPDTNEFVVQIKLMDGTQFGAFYRARHAGYSLNQTYHVAFTWVAGGNITLYVNGVAVDSLATPNVPVAVPATFGYGLENRIGRYGQDSTPAGVQPSSDALIDEYAVYEYALSAAQILDNYTVGTTPGTVGSDNATNIVELGNLDYATGDGPGVIITSLITNITETELDWSSSTRTAWNVVMYEQTDTILTTAHLYPLNYHVNMPDNYINYYLQVPDNWDKIYTFIGLED